MAPRRREQPQERPHESERDFQTWFVDYMRLCGWTLRHISDSRREVIDRRSGARLLVGDSTAADLPDWLCLRGPRLEWVELKGWQRNGPVWRRGQLSENQREFFEVLRRAGQRVWVFWPEDRAQVEEVFR